MEKFNWNAPVSVSTSLAILTSAFLVSVFLITSATKSIAVMLPNVQQEVVVNNELLSDASSTAFDVDSLVAAAGDTGVENGANAEEPFDTQIDVVSYNRLFSKSYFCKNNNDRCPIVTSLEKFIQRMTTSENWRDFGVQNMLETTSYVVRSPEYQNKTCLTTYSSSGMGTVKDIKTGKVTADDAYIETSGTGCSKSKERATTNPDIDVRSRIGGFIVSNTSTGGTPVTTNITFKENALMKVAYSGGKKGVKYNITLKAFAEQLIPNKDNFPIDQNYDDFSRTKIPCNKIRIFGKKLNSTTCSVTFRVDGVGSSHYNLIDVTPDIDVPYYSFGIKVI